MVYRRTERAERVRAAARARILSAARKLIRIQGVEGTTIQHIVAEAGSSVGNLYFYFRNKEALLLAVIAEIFGLIWRVGEEEMAAVSEGPGRMVVLQHVNVIAAYEHPDLAELVLSDRFDSVVSFIETVQQLRFKTLLSENVPGLEDDELDLAVAAWAGVARNALLQQLRGRCDVDFLEMARFISRWNLTASGLSPAEVKRALSVAEDLDFDRIAASLRQLPWEAGAD